MIVQQYCWNPITQVQPMQQIGNRMETLIVLTLGIAFFLLLLLLLLLLES
jgi:hypothetical protein